ncbi:MAG TPA: phosphatidylglycerol lysyltransferase domain-containing protein [Nitrospirota bacterium]|nr:phosphatidylglycerol lysyltransferase domain-containing protein [Nitrospirota bacterium]
MQIAGCPPHIDALDKIRASYIMGCMVIERLGLEHRELLTPLLKLAKAGLSEYTFANLYLFRLNHNYEVLTDGDRQVYIKGRSYDGRTYLMPTVHAGTLNKARVNELLRTVDFLFPIPEAWLTDFPETEFDIQFKEGDRDYVYTVEKMSTYKGRNLHKKRNLLKQFRELYRHDAKPLTNNFLDEARFILQDWQTTSNMDRTETDYTPCLEALDRYEELVLCGGIYYADGEPAGFLLGEEINDETFVLHFAKGRTKFKGVYQFMFNNFAQVLPPKYKYLNLEQDLDRENLRVFKSSYVPDLMLRKARVRLKE